MNPYFKKENSKKEKCYIYKKNDGTEKELDLDVHRSFLLFRYFNHNIPENKSPLLPTHLCDDEMLVVYKCVLLSYLSYKDRNIIEFPPEIKPEFEKFDSTVGRIPFFIVTDTSINAIIISCRGSSCMDDFITDSMGNGVQYDGGKFHEGVFNTATYVFHSCQNKVIELNRTFNHENIEAHQMTESSQSQADNLSISDDDNVNSTADKNATKSKNNKKSRKSTKQSKDDDNDDNDDDNDNDNKDIKTSNKGNDKKSKTTKSSVDQEATNRDLFNKTKKNRTKIIFTGHSLGAAVAGVVTYLFRKHLPQLDAQCICFAPPPTMTFNIWQTTGNYMKSFMIEGDLVPFLSVQNLLHISDIMFPGQTSNQAFKKFVHKYLKKKSVEEVQAIAVLTDTFYPPGQMYLLRFTDNETDDANNDKKKKKKKKGKNKDDDDDNIQLCQILNPDYFSSIVKNIQESNHAIKNYMRMIIRLMIKSEKSKKKQS